MVEPTKCNDEFWDHFFPFWLLGTSYIHTYVPNRYKQETFYLTPVAKNLATRWADKEIGF